MREQQVSWNISRGVISPSSTFWPLLKYAWKCVHDQCHTHRILKVSTDMQYFGKPLEDLGEWEKIIFTSIIFCTWTVKLFNPQTCCYFCTAFFLHFHCLNAFNLLFPPWKFQSHDQNMFWSGLFYHKSLHGPISWKKVGLSGLGLYFSSTFLNFWCWLLTSST